MRLRSRLVHELKQLGGTGVLDLTPSQVCKAVCDVLDAPGAGLVLTHPLLQLPLGAAGDGSVRAEQLEATFGEGPSLAAAASGGARSYTEAALTQRWPLLHAALVAQTPYGSTTTIPLRRTDGSVFACLDLYHAGDDPRPGQAIGVVDAEVGELVGMLLLIKLNARDRSSGWSATELARRRRVWVAVGMTMETMRSDDAGALSVLRAYAFRHDLLLDDVAGHMVHDGRLTPDEVLSDY